jgi:ribonuclease PH
VLSGSGRLVEVQFTSEDVPLRRDQFEAMLDLAETGVRELIGLQRQALALEP